MYHNKKMLKDYIISLKEKVFKKKSVSPLIASILLIALTVSIGAMIIGWGKSYIQKQATCMGLQLYITDFSTNNTINQINLTIQNNGDSIDLKKIPLIVYVKYTDTKSNLITKTITCDGVNTNCTIYPLNDDKTTTTTISSGEYYKIVLTVGNKVDDLKYAKIDAKGCGTISNVINRI